MKTPSNITLTSITAVKKSISMSMKQFTRTVDNQRWKLDVNWSVLTQAEYREISAFLIDKTSKSFTVAIPELTNGLGTWSNVKVSMDPAALSTASKTLAVVSDNDIFTEVKVGDFFRAGASTKVYQVTKVANVYTDSGYEKQISFFPSLITTPSNDEFLEGKNVEFTVKTTDNEMAVPISSNQTYSLGYTALEV